MAAPGAAKRGARCPGGAFAGPPIMKNNRRGKTPVASQEVVGGPPMAVEAGVTPCMR